MRMAYFMFISLVLSLLLSACGDSSKIDDLTKANAALTAELQECRASAKKDTVQDDSNKKEAEAFKRTKEELNNMKKTPF